MPIWQPDEWENKPNKEKPNRLKDRISESDPVSFVKSLIFLMGAMWKKLFDEASKSVSARAGILIFTGACFSSR
jgi:hypothetical protein